MEIIITILLIVIIFILLSIRKYVLMIYFDQGDTNHDLRCIKDVVVPKSYNPYETD